MSGGRSRARRRRGLIRDMLRSYIECSLRWLQTSCLRLSEAPIGRSLRQLVSRAAKEACCTSPLEFSGDKRGCLREVLANIVSRIPPSVNIGLIQCQACAMELRRKCTSTCRGVAHPSSTKRNARSRLCRLSGRLATKVDRSVKPIAPSFFNVSMHQWRSVVRRMVRCKLAVALPSDTCPVQWSGGAAQR